MNIIKGPNVVIITLANLASIVSLSPLLGGFFRFWSKTYFYHLYGLNTSIMMGATDNNAIMSNLELKVGLILRIFRAIA